MADGKSWRVFVLKSSNKHIKKWTIFGHSKIFFLALKQLHLIKTIYIM